MGRLVTLRTHRCGLADELRAGRRVGKEGERRCRVQFLTIRLRGGSYCGFVRDEGFDRILEEIVGLSGEMAGAIVWVDAQGWVSHDGGLQRVVECGDIGISAGRRQRVNFQQRVEV